MFTAIQKAIMQEIKNHNKTRELEEFNKGIQFKSMDLYNKEGYENFAMCSDGIGLTRYKVECSFKPAGKWDNNVVMYQVNIYSNGEVVIYFDGTRFE